MSTGTPSEPESLNKSDLDEINIGDLIWAKMKGFSPWPGKVCNPPPTIKRPRHNKVMHCVWFFGSNNYGWIESHNVKPYQKYKSQLSLASKSTLFKEACAAIENYIERKAAGVDVDLDVKVNVKDETEEESTEEEPTTKKTKGRGRRPMDVENGDDGSKPVAPKKRRVSNNEKKTKPVNNSPRKSTAASFLDRPSGMSKPDAEPINVTHVSQTLKDKKVEPSSLRFGFLGLGNMGSGMVKNLLNSGHKVTVWNRSPEKCAGFVEAGAEQAMTPSDVVSNSDVTFSCVSDPQAAKDMFFGNCGVLHELNASKGYVEMTGIDHETALDISEAVSVKGARFLEAQVQGSKKEAEEGTLVILSSGDRTLYKDCFSTFQAMGKNSFFLGDTGTASKMNLILQLITGVSLGALAEGMALADRAGLAQTSLLEILNLTGLRNPLFQEKGEAILNTQYTSSQPLKHMQKDLNLALSMGNEMDQPLPLAATANEVYKHAKRLGYDEHDVAAIYIRARF